MQHDPCLLLPRPPGSPHGTLEPPSALITLLLAAPGLSLSTKTGSPEKLSQQRRGPLFKGATLLGPGTASHIASSEIVLLCPKFPTTWACFWEALSIIFRETQFPELGPQPTSISPQRFVLSSWGLPSPCGEDLGGSDTEVPLVSWLPGLTWLLIMVADS